MAGERGERSEFRFSHQMKVGKIKMTLVTSPIRVFGRRRSLVFFPCPSQTPNHRLQAGDEFNQLYQGLRWCCCVVSPDGHDGVAE